jgi:predicted HicB family RNase H-like nuclease
MAKKFRRPNEMNQNADGRVPLSTRVRASLRDKLQREAKKADISLTFLVEQVLEDYVKFLEVK